MKQIAVVVIASSLIALFAAASCGDDETAVDGGGVTGEQTEAYFGLAGTSSYTGELEIEGGATTPIDYEVAHAIDTTSFDGRRTVTRTWKTGGFAILTEWFEARADKLYFLRYLYNDPTGKAVDVKFPADTPVWYGKNPWTDADPALSTSESGGTWEYSIVKESVTVPAGAFDDALKVYATEGGRSGAYYLVPNKGVVKFQISKHPALGTINVGLCPAGGCAADAGH